MEAHLEFHLQKTKIDDGEHEHINDICINNMIYSPVELKCLSIYELVERYEMKSEPRGNILVISMVLINIMWKVTIHITS